jgi:hypothetical protein
MKGRRLIKDDEIGEAEKGKEFAREDEKGMR